MKTNYRNKYQFNIQCRLCDKYEDSERHYLVCEKIINNLDPSIELKTANYEHIFSSDIVDQINITKIYDQIFKLRSKLLASAKNTVI